MPDNSSVVYVQNVFLEDLKGPGKTQSICCFWREPVAF